MNFKKLLSSGALLSFSAMAQVKISQLPLGSGAGIVTNDSFPYVESSDDITKRLGLYDLVNIPIFAETFAPLQLPVSSFNHGTGASATTYWRGDGTWAAVSGGSSSGPLVVYGSIGSPLTIVPSTGIASTTDHRALFFVEGQSGMGPQYISAASQISAGTIVGQELILKGISASDYPVLQDGSGLSLNGMMKLNANSSIYLVWDSSVWNEISRK